MFSFDSIHNVDVSSPASCCQESQHTRRLGAHIVHHTATLQADYSRDAVVVNVDMYARFVEGIFCLGIAGICKASSYKS